MNQGNKDVRQITPEEIAQAEGLPMPMTQEELQKTQVLNLTELENTIRIEKISSKKPAIIVAVIGILLLTFGATFQIASSLSSNKEQKVENRKVENPEPKVTTSLKCVKTTLNNPNGTDVKYNISYNFEDNKLTQMIKKYSVTAISGNPTGAETIKSASTLYQSLLNSIDGYKIDLTSDKVANLQISIDVNFKSLDLTKLSQANQNNGVTKVDYSRSTTKEQVKEDMVNQGFTCE